MQGVPGRQQQDDQSDNSHTNSQSTLLGGQNQCDGQENDPTPHDRGGADNNVDKSVFGKAIEMQARQMQQDQRGGREQSQNSQDSVIKEDQIFEKNTREKVRRAEEVMSMLNTARRGLGGQSEMVDLAQIGTATQSVTNWKRVLKSALEEEDEIWGHRFSDKRSGYVARIQDVEYDESRDTEIILDTSGSVSIDLCKNFLRQVKTILKDSELKVGTFSDEFHGFVKIKKGSDFDELKLSVGGGTNFDAASRAFSKSKDVNRICFTDGQDCGGAGIRDKRSDIIWISYGNSSFKPDNGKVLYVPVSEINAVQKKNEPEMSR